MHLATRSILALVTLSLTVVPGLRTIAKAQSLSGLPACTRPALLAAIQASGCGQDTECMCNNPKVIPTLVAAIQRSCDPAEQAAVEAFGRSYCSSLTATGEATAQPSKSTTTTGGPPSEVPLPGYTLPTSSAGALTIDTSASPSKSQHTSYHHTMTYSTTSTAKPTNGTQVGGAADGMATGLSAAALAVAVGALGWVFTEL